MIKAQVGQLLQKEMDRKDFLRHVGIAVAVVAGVPAFIAALNRLQSGSATSAQRVGYGSSSYGGDKQA